MKRFRLERKEGKRGDTVLLVEHPPVYTVGVQGGLEADSVDGIPVYRVERGGLATFHGPGQIVGYPIVDLTPMGRDVRAFVHALEGMIARAIEPFGLVGRRVDGKRGVWIGEKKIASVGIAVQDWVTYHGFALNVSTDLNYFERIHPCGFEGKIMTSMEKQLDHPVSVEEVKLRLREAIDTLWTPSGVVPVISPEPV